MKWCVFLREVVEDTHISASNMSKRARDYFRPHMVLWTKFWGAKIWRTGINSPNLCPSNFTRYTVYPIFTTYWDKYRSWILINGQNYLKFVYTWRNTIFTFSWKKKKHGNMYNNYTRCSGPFCRWKVFGFCVSWFLLWRSNFTIHYCKIWQHVNISCLQHFKIDFRGEGYITWECQ